MKKQSITIVLCGLFGCIGHGVPYAKAEIAMVLTQHSPIDLQLSAMFSQVAPQLSTELGRVVTVGELHEG